MRHLEAQQTASAPDELSQRISAAGDSVTELLRAAQWASENQLQDRAAEVYAKVLVLEPQNMAAHRALCHVQFEGKWLEFDAALKLAQTRLWQGKPDAPPEELAAALEQAAPPGKGVLVEELRAAMLLRAGKFAQASKAYAMLAMHSDGAIKLRAGAASEILAENKDGMYVLSEPYPPGAGLAAGKAALDAGPASLSEPLVLEAALRDRAKREIASAKAIIADAAKIEASDPDAANARYASAEAPLGRAEALAGGAIARTYRVEIARSRIGAIRRSSDVDAKRFDREVEQLGKGDMFAADYKNMIVRLLHLLDNIASDLKAALVIAKPYPQELVLEIKWAELDLRRIEGLQETLKAELDAKD